MSRICFFVVVLAAFACDKGVVEPGLTVGSGNLRIRTDSSAYRSSTVSNPWTMNITATLLNQSKDTFFARIGDSMEPLDQNWFYVAQGSDGFVEKLENNSWTEKQRAMLIEGVRVIAIRPSKSYLLQSILSFNQAGPGTFRIRIHYYRFLDSVQVGSPLIDYSNTFTIK